MKKIYLLALSAICGVSAMAQVSVTFQVDMNGQTVSPNGVHVAGDWQSEALLPADWQPGTAEMTDDDSDGIYSLTVDLPAGQYEYKFINDNDWPGGEDIPQINKTGISDNRFFVITDYHAANGFDLPAVLFSGSAPAGEVAVRLTVDMASESVISENGVHVAGELFSEQWNTQYGAMFSSANSKYVYVAHVAPNTTYEYKFLNGNDVTDYEWAGIAGPVGCTQNDNRFVEVVSEDVTMESVCFGVCTTCADPAQVMFTVNMSNVTVTEGVFLAGSFNNFDNEPMTDNGDGTYSVELTLEPGTYQFKFKNGPGNDGWEEVPASCQGEGTANRDFTVVEAEELSITMCYSQCEAECATNPNPSDITFRVNMEDAIVSPDGVWVMGGFTTPPWQAGAIAMTDVDADGVYEVTVEAISGSADIVYKFANGDPTLNEETGDFLTGGCGVSNGLEGYNRTLQRSGEPMVLDVVCYNACVNCDLVGLEEIGLGEVTLFPNPSNGVTYLNVQNPKGYTLKMSLVDITGKTVRENVVLNSSRNEINTKNLNAGLYFLNIVNEQNERSVYKLTVR